VETDLYAPVKRYLERLGFEVKGEVCGCDIVALKDGAPVAVVIAELKLTFTLDLVLQAVDRMALADEVWLAVSASKRGKGREGDKRVRKLCRLLGVGLLSVFAKGHVEVLAEPGPYKMRANTRRRSRLLLEHKKRRGDPTSGGSTRQPILTAYRQQALDVARALADGPMRPRDLKATCPDAAKILQRDVYGWFERAERGVYTLRPAGAAALLRWAATQGEPSPGRASTADAA
jgi:hypothetical protein